MTRVWKDSKQKGSTLLLLLALADNYNDDRGCAWPSVAYLARKCRMTERNTQLLLSRLAESGEITIDANAGPNGCNVYRLADIGRGGENFSPRKTAREGMKSSASRGENSGAQNFTQTVNGNRNEPNEPPAAGGPGHQAFIDLWHEAYQMQFGRNYVMHGGADGKAAKALIAATKMTPGELMRVITAAWSRRGNARDFWACENKTDTIRDVAANWNRIVSELDKVPHGGLGGESITKKAGRTPPPGLKPLSQRPPPGLDDNANEITADEYEKRFPLSAYYDEQTLKPLG